MSEPDCSQQAYAEAQYEHGFRELLDEIAILRAEVERLQSEVAFKQAQIDALMLEYCPQDMTVEQKAEWARHQVSLSLIGKIAALNVGEKPAVWTEEMSDVKVTTAAMVAEDITSAFARMPKRDEGVHWLRAWEWDLLRCEDERLRMRQTCEGGRPYICHTLATARATVKEATDLLKRWHESYGEIPTSKTEVLNDDTASFLHFAALGGAEPTKEKP